MTIRIFTDGIWHCADIKIVSFSEIRIIAETPEQLDRMIAMAYRAELERQK